MTNSGSTSGTRPDVVSSFASTSADSPPGVARTSSGLVSAFFRKASKLLLSSQLGQMTPNGHQMTLQINLPCKEITLIPLLHLTTIPPNHGETLHRGHHCNSLTISSTTQPSFSQPQYTENKGKDLESCPHSLVDVAGKTMPW